MIRHGSVVYCKDNTGVKLVRVIQVVGGRHKRKANIGDRVLVVIQARNLRAKNLQNERQLLRFRRGSVHRALVVNVKT
jgi:ribosomal protein L14